MPRPPRAPARIQAPSAAPAPREARGAKVTINDIARLANVSKKTVSRVINQSPFLKEETRARIQAIMAEQGYAPDPQARGLAFRRSFLIGLVYDNPNAQYVIDMQQGILDAVRGSGFELIVHPCSQATPRFLDDVRAFVERQKLFGVVLPPPISENDALCRLLDEIDCPYARIASVPLDEPDRMLVTHDHKGGEAAALHLADLGHRIIGMVIGPPNFRSSGERHRGFARGLAARGLDLPAARVVTGAYTFESGIAAGRALIALSPRPTAIFAGNDEMAAGVCRAAREAGLDIPGDLSVVGYDDSPIAGKIWPPLTSVRLPIRDMGRIAAEKILVRAREGAVEAEEGPGTGAAPPPAEEVTPGLVPRQSAAPPRA